jgi:hypothetical protein
VPAITGELLRELLTPDRADCDWSSIHALVTAARVDVDVMLESAPNLSIPTLAADGGSWVVGPLDVSGQAWPAPIALHCEQSWGSLRVSIEVQWELWSRPGRVEHTALLNVERALDAAGFRTTQDA